MLNAESTHTSACAEDEGNPLLVRLGVPDFSRVRPDHVEPAIARLLAEADAALEQVADGRVADDYEAVSASLDVAVERLMRAWEAVVHLNEVLDTPALRAVFNTELPKVAAFHTRMGADARLFAKVRRIAASPAAATFTSARMQALQHALRDFVLDGAELQGAARERFDDIQERLVELGQRFAENVLDATDGFALFATEQQIGGIPLDVLREARRTAAASGREGYKLTLHAPCLLPALRNAHDRDLRQALYTANLTRASELGDVSFDNSAVMAEIVELRQELAGLLGMANYAQLSLAPKMAGSTAEVFTLLDTLATRARPHALRDLAELRDFAANELGLAELAPWDVAYATERLNQQRYAFSCEQVREYFGLERVLEGLFEIVQTLFDLSIEPAPVPVWHPSVRHYRMHRRGQPIGSFYLDLHAREGKRSGAWMGDAQSRWARPDAGGLQLPVAHLVCNFASPEVVDGRPRPALLSHDDLITLFHEFGHGLHHLLTTVDELPVAGISGVEWDAIELPSQWMENFCWEWPVLSRLSAHVDSGEALPRALFDKMLAAKNFQSGLNMLRHMEFALFDMRVHTEAGAASRLQAVMDDVRSQVALLPVATFNRFQHSFSHIFDGGYAAGYYSYAWAEVLSADAWSAFEEAGIFDADTGRKYREQILERGGSRDALANFKAFRGREPRIDALLRHQGMA
ncbi:MAG: M3 family metallopeptidase [Rubrivivax sp.]